MPRRRKGRRVDGVLLVDKPAGETSNRTLQRVRARFQARKAGHTGTLDPFATGLLPLCFGEATKFGTGLLDADKSYIATASWGTRTDTGDLDGEVVERTDVPMPTRETLAATLAARFSGTIEQVPPMYSALKHDGQRLHEIARAGGEVTREARQVRIVDAAIIGAEEGQFSLAVTCSKGTYIRVLVEDLAKACGGLAHCIALRRTGVGPFSVDDARSPDVLETVDASELDGLLEPVDAALTAVPKLSLDSAQAAAARHGHAFLAGEGEGGEPGDRFRLYDGDRFLGIAERVEGSTIAPRRLVDLSGDQ